MVEKAGISLLVDYYGAFLTERQLKLTRMSVDEDMSLSEIAQEVGVSRQGVRESLVTAAEKLEEFEKKLGLVERDRRLNACLDRLTEAVEEGRTDEAIGIIDSIRSAIN